MDVPVSADQERLTYISSVQTQDAALKILSLDDRNR